MANSAPGANPIQLVLADVDGTLVTHDKVLTPRARAAVAKLRAAQIQFAITSGRPPRGVRMLNDALHLTTPIAGFNGGVIVNPDYSVLAAHYLAADLARAAIEKIRAQNLDVWLYTDTDWFVADLHAPHVAREQWTVKFPPTVTNDFDAALERAVKIVGVGDDYALVERAEKVLQQWGGDRISAERSQPYYLDVTHPLATKGYVVTLLADMLKIPTARIATIGDMPNDILMFEKSGMSIAMGNAGPLVQQAATFVTFSCDDDGFANAMEKFILHAE